MLTTPLAGGVAAASAWQAVAMSAMTCPKCRGEMHSYERNGVTVDQCADCRGIFLDRGEL